MPDAKSYEIYWENQCGEMNKLENFEIIKKFKTPMEIVSISFSREESQTCSTSSFTSLYVTTATEITGTVSGVVLTDGTNDLTFSSCTIASTVITCTASAQSTAGSYTFKSMTASDFSFSYTEGATFKHETVFNPLAQQETTGNKNFEINSSQLSFVITMETGLAKPTIYLGNDVTKEISCNLESNQLTCSLESENVLVEDSYFIFYKGACGKLYQSKLKISKIKEVIKVTSIAIVGETEGVCLKNAFNTVKVGVEKDPKDVTAIVLTANSIDYTFSTCTSDENYVQCSNPDKEIIAETYEIKSIKSVTYNFNFDDVDNVLKYAEDFLNDATEKNQQINKDVSEFVLYLKAETDIYLGDANGQDKITCTKKKDNNEYSCPLDIADFGEEKTFQVYYNDSCGQLTDAGITVSIVFPTEIQITNVSLVEESKCIVNSLHSVTLTADKSPKSKIYHAILVNSKNEQFDLEQCTFEGTEITCSFCEDATPITTVGFYKLKEVKGVDTITIADEVKEIELELKDQPSVLGEQGNLAPTLNGNDTKTFSIVLASAETEAPNVYCGKDKDQQITCEKTGTELVCTPSETNMPNADDYEIYYEDLCGNLQTTGITVTYEPKAEIVIETKGGFLMYRFVLGMLLVLMF